MSHSGWLESCHPRCSNVDYYRQKHCQTSFIEALEKGDFITCGTSGDIPFMFDRNGKRNFRIEREKFGSGQHCCCFVYGQGCKNNVLRRRWTCCGIEAIGTIADLTSIPCSKTKIEKNKDYNSRSQKK